MVVANCFKNRLAAMASKKGVMGVELVFREIVPEDAAVLAAIEAESIAMPWNREMFWEELGNPDTFYLAAVVEGEVVAFVGCWLLSGEADITNVAVRSKYRRQGIARRLLIELIRRLKMQGITAVSLEVRESNIPAIALYSGLNFKHSGIRPNYYQNPPENAIIMWKTDL